MKDGEANRGRWSDPERARAAAQRSRESRQAINPGEPTVFVLRMPHPSSLLAWEIRRYTAIVLARGEGYATEDLARAAGQRALIAISAVSAPANGTASR